MNYLPASKEVLEKLSKMVKSKMFMSEESGRSGSSSEQIYKKSKASGGDEVLVKAIKKAVKTLDDLDEKLVAMEQGESSDQVMKAPNEIKRQGKKLEDITPIRSPSSSYQDDEPKLVIHYVPHSPTGSPPEEEAMEISSPCIVKSEQIIPVIIQGQNQQTIPTIGQLQSGTTMLEENSNPPSTISWIASTRTGSSITTMAGNGTISPNDLPKELAHLANNCSIVSATQEVVIPSTVVQASTEPPAEPPIKLNRKHVKAGAKAPHFTHVRLPLGLRGVETAKRCVSFGSARCTSRKVSFNVVSITDYNAKQERCGRGIRLFLPQWEELLLFKRSIASAMQDVSMGADIDFTLKLGGGIKVSINHDTANAEILYFQGKERSSYPTDIGVSLEKEEWESLMLNAKVINDKIKMHVQDTNAVPFPGECNEHIHRTV